MEKNVSRRNFLKVSTALTLPVIDHDFVSESRAQTPVNNASNNGLSRIQTISEPGRWSDYSRERDPVLDIVQADSFTLNQASAGGNNLYVICDQLTIDGSVALPGMTIWLVARRIIAKNTAVLDTSGISPAATMRRAEDGRSPGKPGDKGAKGEDGKNAGGIILVFGSSEGNLLLKANGGNGANGQDGGTGAIGPTGMSGTHATRKNPPGNGEQGLPGGIGGMGGEGGNGGAAGDIVIICGSGDFTNVTILCDGGKPGANGSAGQGGPGGLGGQPGERCYQQMPRGVRGTDYYDPGDTACYENAASPGPRGPTGPDGPINSYIPQVGQPKSSQKIVASFRDIAPYIPLTQLKMALSNAYISFANLDSSDLLEKLVWIYEISASANSGKRFFDERAARAGAPDVGRPSPAEVSVVANQALQLIQRIRVGLDAFGFAQNYVSHLSPKYLTEASDRLLSIASSVESEHEKYLTAMSSLQDASEPLKASLVLAKETIEQTEKNIQEYDTSANRIQGEIATLAETIEVIRQKLLNAESEFQKAVVNKGNCSLLKMIEFVIGVVAISYGMYQGAIAIADSFKKANSTETDGNVIKDMQFLIDTFDRAKVDQYFKKMQEGFAKVEESLKKNETKLVISLEAFEGQLQPYLDMPEAVKYRELMRQLVEVARARNDKQVMYTQLVLNSAKSKIDITALSLELERIKTLVSQTNNPSLADCVIFLTSLLSRLKFELVALLDLRRRSLIYATLVPIRPNYKFSRVVELRDAQTYYDQKLLEAMKTRGREQQTFDADFVLPRARFPWVFEQLSSGREASFAIPLNDPQFNRGGTSFVTIYQVRLSVAGIRTRSGQFTCRLVHQGNSLLLDQNRASMNFSHNQRVTILSYKQNGNQWNESFDTDNNLGGSDEHFLYLSPFAT